MDVDTRGGVLSFGGDLMSRTSIHIQKANVAATREFDEHFDQSHSGIRPHAQWWFNFLCHLPLISAEPSQHPNHERGVKIVLVRSRPPALQLRFIPTHCIPDETWGELPEQPRGVFFSRRLLQVCHALRAPDGTSRWKRSRVDPSIRLPGNMWTRSSNDLSFSI